MKKEILPKAGSGKFQKLASKIEQSEEKSGMSNKKAKEIGNATAAKIWFEKFGKKKMETAAKAGKKLAEKKKQ